MNRRTFVFTGTGAAATVAAAAPSANAMPAAPHTSRPGLWVDPKLLSLPAKPWRKIHLDFHNSEFIPAIGEKFNADEFGDRLLAGNVDSVVVFAKDMHGYFYYPSKYGPVHPGLKFDLLAAQVEACRKRKITVYAYYCTTWDNYLAAHHPEWLVIRRDGSNYLPKAGQTPRWTALCIAQEGFVRLMEEHTREFVSHCPIDGAWFDMPYPIGGECFCPECVRQLKERGQDPQDVGAQRNHKQELEMRFLERLTKVVREARPGCQTDFNNQAAYGLGDRARWMDNIDLEALPSAAQWGYYFFPLVARYTRNFGLSNYGMTGRFKASWADFGGLKLPTQLHAECASIVANASRCDVGDQMHPAGRLDPAIYHVIGRAYGHIKSIQPYLEGAAPVAEAAMIVSGHPLDELNSDAHLGWVKLLTECRVQFDVVEPHLDWERYGLIVLPEGLAVDGKLAERLKNHVARGGAVIASHDAGAKGWMESYGFSYHGLSEFKPAYMIPEEKFTGDIPRFEYALYEGASHWKVSPPGRVVATLGEPLFQRSAEHYTSHAQTPFDHSTGFAAVAVSGRVGLFGFPLGASYFRQGYWVYRSALRHLLESLLPAQLLKTDAPVSTELTVTRQERPAGRYLVHIVNWSANRGTPLHPVFHEEPIPLTNVRVRLNLPLAAQTVRAVVSGASLPARRVGRGVEVTVPRVAIHEVLVFA
jgi:hypothetical protein